ncbi:MAG: AAA family ATPase [Pirellulaceae bacterium]|nr:AAA family ATPase [Pirellulaceae bacterium]
MSNPLESSPVAPTLPEQPLRPELPLRTAPSPQRSDRSVSNDGNNPDNRLEGLLNRINHIASGDVEDDEGLTTIQPELEYSSTGFMPAEPTTFEEAGLTETQIEELIMKFLLARGDAEGRQVAEQIKIPFALVDQLLRRLKHEQMVVYRDQAQINDYRYQLTDMGRERARRYSNDCSYYGAAPVSLRSYVESVKAQSLTSQHPTANDLKRAFADLLINQQMFAKLGPAINSGRGMFLFGFPGNGKTSIAERITKCFGDHVWIPRAIGLEGEIIRVFDPNHHEEIHIESNGGLLAESKADKRWVCIRRPTIIVGGELTMEHLELRQNSTTNINEAPIQMKSNCGTLVIDDFGRQRMRTDELLNRWIVPLEKRYDFLNLPSGKSIQVPFDQLVVFSTNLEPKDLVDDAFLRRIPYKIEVENPSQGEFIELFKIMSPIMGIEYDDQTVRYLIEKHYTSVNRPFRCCQPRDILLQVRNLALYEGEQPEMSEARMDFAVENYFAVM